LGPFKIFMDFIKISGTLYNIKNMGTSTPEFVPGNNFLVPVLASYAVGGDVPVPAARSCVWASRKTAAFPCASLLLLVVSGAPGERVPLLPLPLTLGRETRNHATSEDGDDGRVRNACDHRRVLTSAFFQALSCVVCPLQ
jgi:hypothetical protein